MNLVLMLLLTKHCFGTRHSIGFIEGRWIEQYQQRISIRKPSPCRRCRAPADEQQLAGRGERQSLWRRRIAADGRQAAETLFFRSPSLQRTWDTPEQCTTNLRTRDESITAIQHGQNRIRLFRDTRIKAFTFPLVLSIVIRDRIISRMEKNCSCNGESQK